MTRWVRVTDYPNYEVSDDGQVRRRGRVLKPYLRPSGYLIVGLHDGPGRSKIRRIHHLVLEAFVAPRPLGQVCNHIDGVKTNNVVANLEWVTSSENNRHAHATGLNPVGAGPKNPRAKLTAEDVRTIRTVGSSMRQVDLAAMFNVTSATISAVLRHRHYKDVA